MKSPVEPHSELLPLELETGLPAWRCPDSGGVYLKAADYWQWLANQPGRLETLPKSDHGATPADDSGAPARICPETSGLMSRFRVGHGLAFHIDRSPTGGFWLDAGEWEALKERDFHDEIHRIFTGAWQKEVRTEQAREALDAQFRQLLGADDYTKVAEFREWMTTHPARHRMLAWLGEPLS